MSNNIPNEYNEGKCHKIILIDAEKALNEAEAPFMIKSPTKSS
jgi:hypothetical protein